MCARITQRYESDEIARAIGLPFEDERLFRREEWNGAPGMRYAIVELAPAGGALRVGERHWGLVPRWARDDTFSAANARAETAAAKPSFRDAMRSSRGLLPVTGWYEWQGRRPPKQPYHIRAAGGGLLLLAVLCEPPRPGGRFGKTFSVLTTVPQQTVARVHDRQPAIIEGADAAAWLDRTTPADTIRALARGNGACALEAWPVSTRVNRAGQGGAELIRRDGLASSATPKAASDGVGEPQACPQ